MKHNRDEEYAPIRFHTYPWGPECEMVHSPSSGKTLPLHPMYTSILKKLSGFKTLREHANAVCSMGWMGDDERLLVQCLDELAGMKLLRRRSELFDEIISVTGAKESPPGIGILAWSTRDRPALLARGMESFAANARRYGRSPDMLVIDDSRETKNNRENRTALATVAKRHGLVGLYADASAVRSFAARLCELTGEECARATDLALFDPDNCGLTYGAARNAVLLATAGRMLMSSDDDMVCEIAHPYEPSGGIELSSLADLNEVYFFPDRASLETSLRRTEDDIIARHESFLGRVAQECLAENGGDIHLKIVTQDLLELLGSGPCRVRASAAGTWGDSGMGSPRVIFSLRDEARQRLVATERTYRSAFESREILQLPRRPTITSGPFFPGMNIGLDNRELLPPFFPVMRGEDFNFAATLRLCCYDGLIAFPSVALAHRPGEMRAFPPGEALEPSLNLSELLFLALRSFQQPEGRIATAFAMEALGMHLENLARMHPADYEHHMKTLWLSRISYSVTYIEQSLALYDRRPDFWADDLNAYVASIERFALNGTITVPRDLLPGRTVDEARALGQRLIGRYGDLLRWWPSIWNAARKLNTEGKGLARPVN